MPLTGPQRTIAEAEQRFRVACCGRRFCKTHLALRELARFARFPRQRVYYTAPTYRQAKSIAWVPLKEKLIELRWVEKVNEQDLSITLRNASTISVREEVLMQISSLINPEALALGLAKETRSERMEQRVKPSMKQIIEYAATLSGTDTSEFVSTAAFQAAMDKIGALSHTRLEGEDAARFFAALERKPEPNQAMKDLMVGYDESLDEA